MIYECQVYSLGNESLCDPPSRYLSYVWTEEGKNYIFIWGRRCSQYHSCEQCSRAKFIGVRYVLNWFASYPYCIRQVKFRGCALSRKFLFHPVFSGFRFHIISIDEDYFIIILCTSATRWDPCTWLGKSIVCDLKDGFEAWQCIEFIEKYFLEVICLLWMIVW